MAGHLLECGAQVTGGYYADPGVKDVAGMATLGYPIAQIDAVVVEQAVLTRRLQVIGGGHEPRFRGFTLALAHG